MKLLFFIFWFSSLFSIQAQGFKVRSILIVTEKEGVNRLEPDIFNIRVVLKTNEGYEEMLKVSNYLEDVSFVCRFFDKLEKEVFVFSNFDSPTGGRKLFFLCVESFDVYSTDFLHETLIPQIFSFDRINQTLKCISIDIGKCGEIIYYPLKQMERTGFLNRDFNKFRIIKEIRFMQQPQ